MAATVARSGFPRIRVFRRHHRKKKGHKCPLDTLGDADQGLGSRVKLVFAGHALGAKRLLGMNVEDVRIRDMLEICAAANQSA